MNKAIILSLALISVVGVVATGATISYFTDTETSTGNTFTAGTIDISVDGENPWTESFTLADMKPCYTDYINFRIENGGSYANPVDIYKKLIVTDEVTGDVTEPECTEQSGVWTPDPGELYNGTCVFGSNGDRNDLSSDIWYDLKVWVYNAAGAEIWHQTIYVDGDKQTIAMIYDCDEVYLGMIPAGGYMLVEQSYHLAPYVTNWAQGDIMTFDIQVRGEQIKGTAVLENKDESQDWKIIHGDGIQGTLTYVVKNSTFDFSFEGEAPLGSHEYFLVGGYDANTNADTLLGSGMTDASGDITIVGDVELGKDLKDAKVWLVPTENWNGSEVTWSPWPGMVANCLWETGLIWYDDTDL